APRVTQPEFCDGGIPPAVWPLNALILVVVKESLAAEPLEHAARRIVRVVEVLSEYLEAAPIQHCAEFLVQGRDEGVNRVSVGRAVPCEVGFGQVVREVVSGRGARY